MPTTLGRLWEWGNDFVDERHRTDPALDLATAFLLHYDHSGGRISPEFLATCRQRYQEFDAGARERFRAAVVEALTRRGVSQEQADRAFNAWFPNDDGDGG